MLPITRRNKRVSLNLKQWDIAVRLECSVGSVSIMETGNGRVSPELIKRYEELLRELTAARNTKG